MSKIKWKAEASDHQEATANNVGGGKLGGRRIDLKQDEDTITVLVNGVPCMTYDDDDGDVANVKVLKPGLKELAEAFNRLLDL